MKDSACPKSRSTQRRDPYFETMDRETRPLERIVKDQPDLAPLRTRRRGAAASAIREGGWMVIPIGSNRPSKISSGMRFGTPVGRIDHSECDDSRWHRNVVGQRGGAGVRRDAIC
jgi:hypothetical protein